jgi:hypothetical protein
MKPLMMVSVSATATATVLLAGSVLAQQAPAPAAYPPPPQQAPAPAAYPPPPPPQQAQAPVAPPPEAAAVPAESDHDAMVGRLGVGYMGRRSMLVGVTPVLGATVMDTVQRTYAPVVGVRYWIDQVVGLDVGLGFSIAAGSQEIDPPPAAPPSQIDDSPITTFILHGGLPLSLAGSKHFSFELVPELNVGYATQTIEDPTATMGDVTNSGLHLDLGARAGAEIYFGFIGVPELSLQGSVGLRIDYDAMSSDQTSGNALNSHRFWFGTTTYDNPWNIFTSNIAALYYF